MNLSLRIARRYLFAKKSTNAINIITGIAVFGVSVGTAALILVLSVFNGFEDLFLGMYNNFNPDIRITATKGKTFTADSALISRMQLAVKGIEATSRVLEEVAFFSYKDKQDFGILKGVDDYYTRVTRIDSTVKEGKYALREGSREQAVLGLGMRNRLAVDISDPFAALTVYIPKRKQSALALEPQFTSRIIYPSGTFLAQQEVDNEYVIASIGLVQDLLKYEHTTVSSLELRLHEGFPATSTAADLQALLGPDYVVKDRLAQEEAFLRLMKIEKWLSFAIPGLMLLLVSFNLIGALWMIVLEKSQDISILKTLGMTDLSVRRVFLYQGLLLCSLGIVIGFVLALILFTLQKTVGIITLPGGMLIDAYPVSLRWYDFPIVLSIVLSIGYMASILPALRAQKMPAMFREE